MAHPDIRLLGAVYSAVPAVELPKDGGGTATYVDTTDADAVAADIALNKTAYVNGVKVTGTGSGGGGVTVTDEPNATGITCVITSGGSPTPPTPDIPLNTELIDLSLVVGGYIVDTATGEEVASQWSSCSGFAPVDSSMTFSFIGYEWYNMVFYDADKYYVHGIEPLREISGTTVDGNGYAHGSISSAQIPRAARYVRISTTPNSPSNNQLSLIRTA